MKNKNFSIDPNYFFKIFNSISDGIYISDKEGKTLWMNSASAKMCRKTKEEMIGKSVAQLEREGTFSPSATKLTLESQQAVSTVQEMANGRKYMVTGHLILNAHNDIEYVVAHSRDITEVVRTASKIEDMEALLRRYSQEIRRMNSKYVIPNDRDFYFIGQSEAYRSLSELIEKVAGVETTVLITGETGVGKNIAAQQIHTLSERHTMPFVHINCASIPESLIESELFGYQKGAFTGANTSGKIGLVKMAEQGTLFLDEIGELPLHLQSKLLQLLQDKTYTPLGAARPLKANVRIIAATNRELETMVASGKFRADLYYRLNILPITIPPLRERREDIFPLLHFYLKKFNEQHNQKRKLSTEVGKILQTYEWPGNIRELENLLEQLVVMAKQEEISLSDLPERFLQLQQKQNDIAAYITGRSLPDILENIEKKVIEHTYKKYKTTRKAAKELGITQSLLVRRMAKYKINSTNETT
ncbi:sigma-54 interaction domain-containing protein [Aneurinibacillus sp. REN35]|uniref:sigma-54 interaction domain-containing protein n=1 Tax=Aneurinibacillus sp. REN35 TaxID=3237286 RepID=UPI0035299261